MHRFLQPDEQKHEDRREKLQWRTGDRETAQTLMQMEMEERPSSSE
jgi:hypothetical protein